MANLVFLHGLNTYGDDDLHVGPLRFGYMHAHWERALRRRGHDVLAPIGLALDTETNKTAYDPETLARRAWMQMRDRGWSDKDDLALIGHSTGGLVARALEPLLRPRVRAIVTIGTPHRGTDAARFARELHIRHGALHKILARLGYDTKARLEIFDLFTADAIRNFDARFPRPNHLALAYALCEIEEAEVSWPLRPLYRRLHASPESIDRSDGFIHSDSQEFGERLGPFALDHFENLGFCLRWSPHRRTEVAEEFERLVDEIDAFLNRHVSK